jgi:3-deoxy-D-manno-octulosonic-acid transferase
MTIIVPRHPERRDGILQTMKGFSLNVHQRSINPAALPSGNTDIFFVDTLGELGLFYRLAPVACIGRSFSSDGGGGHNPIEPAQVGCAVLHGPLIQNLQAIFQSYFNKFLIFMDISILNFKPFINHFFVLNNKR